jgi:hypothetical protein
MRLYVIGSQVHRLISSSFVLKDAEAGNVIETHEHKGDFKEW